jgi:hypothetical protein
VNPDVAAAVDALLERGVLTEEQARVPRRAARGALVSLRGELRVLLYAGVLLASAGAGLLVKANLPVIGPMGIAAGLGAASILLLAWVARTSPPFSRGEVASTHLAFDYLLLLGLLLGAADLAFIEIRFTPLGPGWPWHLLVVSLAVLALSIRFDSRIALSLALGSFAAWRGVSLSFLEWSWWRAPQEALRGNMIVCGLVFVGLGALFLRTRFKPHFEPVASGLGWLVLLGALFSGMFTGGGPASILYAALLAATGALLVWRAIEARRFHLFALGIVGAYAGLSGVVLKSAPSMGPDGVFLFVWFLASALATLYALVRGHATIRRTP